MSENQDFDAYDDDEDDDAVEAPAPESKDIRRLREAAKKLPKVEQRQRELEKENALLRAGLGLTETQEKAVLRLHDGDLTAEAIRATAAEYGFIAAIDKEVDDDAKAVAGISQASVGAQDSGSAKITPADVAKWSAERMLAFRKERPDDMNAILQGESVPA